LTLTAACTTRGTGYDRSPDNSLAATKQPADILQLELLAETQWMPLFYTAATCAG
jgi:hypothetical protein